MIFAFSESCTNQAQVIRSLLTFENLISFTFDKQPPEYELIVDPKFECPMCCRYEPPIQIQLAINGSSIPQAIYQFCHELCHLLIGPNEKQRAGWFEEVLCELSSYYFMYEYNHLVADDLVNYLHDPYFQTIEFDLNDLLDPNAEIYRYLMASKPDRERNRYIALFLLPIAQRFGTDFWRFFSTLSNMDPDLTFAKILESLSTNARNTKFDMYSANSSSDILSAISSRLSTVSSAKNASNS